MAEHRYDRACFRGCTPLQEGAWTDFDLLNIQTFYISPPRPEEREAYEQRDHQPLPPLLVGDGEHWKLLYTFHVVDDLLALAWAQFHTEPEWTLTFTDTEVRDVLTELESQPWFWTLSEVTKRAICDHVRELPAHLTRCYEVPFRFPFAK